MPQYEKFDRAVQYLQTNDLHLARIITKIGACRLSPKKGAFDDLAEAIISQQLSKKAAQTIWSRVISMNDNKPLDFSSFKKLNCDSLKKAGVSSRKISYLSDLAEKIEKEQLDLTVLEDMSDDEVISELTKVKGIGRWTAEMYMIFVLGRMDVFPISDMGIKSSIISIYGIDSSNYEKEAILISNKWRPYRSISSWYLWAHLDLENEER